MALLTLISTLVGWYNLRFISQVEKDNTQALIPTMNMARQLSEASAWELFSAQNLTTADNENMWLAQGRMLTAQSLKITALLKDLAASLCFASCPLIPHTINRFDICVAICFNLTANTADRSSKGMFIYIFFINIPQFF